jgi:hypothetical protein
MTSRDLQIATAALDPTSPACPDYGPAWMPLHGGPDCWGIRRDCLGSARARVLLVPPGGAADVCRSPEQKAVLIDND